MHNLDPPADTYQQSSRRERTHARLQAHALVLFEQQGYERTSVAQIAAAAGVTEMTFFRHFSSKQRVLFDDPYDPLIADAIAAQPRGQSPLRRTLAGVRTAWQRIPEPAEDAVRRRVQVVARTPGLRSAMHDANAETERLIVQQLVADGAPSLDAEVVAAAVLASLTVALMAWSAQDTAPLAAYISAALAVFEGGAAVGMHDVAAPHG